MVAHHIAALLIPSWRHTGSYIYIATQMLQKDPALVITMVQHNAMVAQMEAEIKTLACDTARLRIIGLGDKDLPLGPRMIKEGFGQVLSGWIETVPKLGQGSEGWPKPHAIHMDFFAGGFVVEATKKTMGPDCKMLLWLSCSLVAMPAYLTDYDFAAIAQEICDDDARRQGRSMDDILHEVHMTWNGTDKLSGIVIKAPGVPDRYDHERVPYGAGAARGAAPLFVGAQKLAKLVDGFIVPTGACLEPAAVSYSRELFQTRGQELFTVGIQVHELGWDNAAAVPLTNEVVRSFLENAAAEYGPKSVLYISFGTSPSPTPQLIEALVKTLINLEKPFPFLFALGSKMATLPNDLIERVTASGRGLICKFWVEQRAILQHEAVGWFLTHGGWNSICESLSQGVPLIVWPTSGEQPTNAALLSSGPNPVAIELMQIRTGPQLAPSLRGGPKITGTVEDASVEFKTVFDAARGPEGAILLENAASMATALRETRAGEASEELIRLARF
ncbi:hypothetical protein FB451DRAFT_1566513 [Mycena latifolia]|nr:hypothetical protein FB451DRAFT_1566513 [Mycena latifolia]